MLDIAKCDMVNATSLVSFDERPFKAMTRGTKEMNNSPADQWQRIQSCDRSLQSP